MSPKRPQSGGLLRPVLGEPIERAVVEILLVVREESLARLVEMVWERLPPGEGRNRGSIKKGIPKLAHGAQPILRRREEPGGRRVLYSLNKDAFDFSDLPARPPGSADRAAAHVRAIRDRVIRPWRRQMPELRVEGVFLRQGEDDPFPFLPWKARLPVESEPLFPDVSNHVASSREDPLPPWRTLRDRTAAFWTYHDDLRAGIVRALESEGWRVSAAGEDGTVTPEAVGLLVQYALGPHMGMERLATAAGAKPHDHVFDAQGRLVAATGPWGANEDPETITYEYDAVGNIRSTEVVGSGVTTYSYDYGAWNRLTDRSGATVETYTYNDAGSVLDRDAGGQLTSHTYDYEQRLVRVVTPTWATHTYAYDGFGRRLQTVESFGLTTVTTHAAYAGGTLLFTQSETSGPGMSMSAGTTTDTIYVYLAGQLLLRKTGSEAVRFYHQDASSNVRLVTYYASGTQTDYNYRYRPFGELVELQYGPGADPRFKFAGQELDATGLHHMGARYQDGGIGRFLARDPIGSGYSYGANNPLSFYDPTGLSAYPQPYYGGKSLHTYGGGPDRSILGQFVGWATSGLKWIWGQISPIVEPQIKPLRDLWNALPGWAQAIIATLAVVGLTAVTAWIAPSLLTVGILLSGTVVGLSFAISAIGLGESDPVAVLNAFLAGFAMATTMLDVAILGTWGIVMVGRALVRMSRTGAAASLSATGTKASFRMWLENPRKWQKTWGVLRWNEGNKPFYSGWTEWVPPRGTTGADIAVKTHVEAQVAWFMKVSGIRSATLEINHMPCRACFNYISEWLEPGSRLTVIADDVDMVFEFVGAA